VDVEELRRLARAGSVVKENWKSRRFVKLEADGT
jgi:hypothetical protein